MELLSNSVCRSDLKPGDHIYCYRIWHTYSHHGIFVGADRVIHYNRTKDAEESEGAGDVCKNCKHDPKREREGGVVKTCMDCFLSGHHLYVFEYGVSAYDKFKKRSGTCCTKTCDPADVTIGRATEKLQQGFGEYNLLENNCECFAVFCKTGKAGSDQAYTFKLFVKGKFDRKGSKSVLNIPVTIRLDRLLHDVQVHHPHLYKQTKEFIDPLRKSSFIKIRRHLKRFNIHGNDQEEDVNEDVLSDQEDDVNEEKEEGESSSQR